jgi:hypothetical protein
MPRLRQVPRSEVHERGRPIYDMLFGARCPVTSTGALRPAALRAVRSRSARG